MTPTDIHNRDIGPIIRAIVKPTLEAGGSYTEILVLLESVITGVMLFAVKPGGDDVVLEQLVDGVKCRLAEHRANDDSFTLN
jgi:hypothetical protein